MRMHEDVSLDPGISAVQIEVIIARAVEHVINHLQDGAGPLSASEINGVVKTPGMPKIIIAKDSVATGWDAVHAMQHLRPGRSRIAREETVLHDERTSVKRDVLRDWRIGKGKMIKENLRVVHMNFRVVSANARPAGKFDVCKAQSAFD